MLQRNHHQHERHIDRNGKAPQAFFTGDPLIGKQKKRHRKPGGAHIVHRLEKLNILHRIERIGIDKTCQTREGVLTAKPDQKPQNGEDEQIPARDTAEPIQQPSPSLRDEKRAHGENADADSAEIQRGKEREIPVDHTRDQYPGAIGGRNPKLRRKVGPKLQNKERKQQDDQPRMKRAQGSKERFVAGPNQIAFGVHHQIVQRDQECEKPVEIGNPPGFPYVFQPLLHGRTLSVASYKL